MALSSDTYTASAGQTLFTVTFPYLAQAHVLVYVNGTLRTDYTWTNATTIAFSSGLALNDTVLIRRESSRANKLVDFTDGSSLPESILDLDSNQLFYLVQEAVDAALAALTVGVDGNYSASGRRLTNLANGVAAQDAVTQAQLQAAAIGGVTVTAGSLSTVPSGGLSSTNIQSALNELDAEKVAKAGDTLGGTLNFNGNLAVKPETRGYRETVHLNTTAAGSVNIDHDLANVHCLTLVGNVTLSFVNPPPTNKAGNLTIFLKQDAAGGRAVTFPGAVRWPDGAIPAITATANKMDCYTFTTLDGGATWMGFVSGKAF